MRRDDQGLSVNFHRLGVFGHHQYIFSSVMVRRTGEGAEGLTVFSWRGWYVNRLYIYLWRLGRTGK